MAVGQIYTTVEEGWSRFSAGHSNITYYNFNASSTELSPNTVRYIYPVQANNSTRDDNLHIDSYFPHRYATVKCNFTGTKLRLILAWPHYSLYKENVSVFIDGFYSGKIYTPDTRNNANPFQHYWCGFEKTDLSSGEHTLTIVVEPKSGIFCLACLDLEENAELKATTIISKNQFRTFTGETDSVVNKIKAGKIITAKYIEYNHTQIGDFFDLKLTNNPIEKEYYSGSGTHIPMVSNFDFYQTPEDTKMYELTKNSVIFKASRTVEITDGVSEAIDPSNYQEIISVDTENASITVIPKAIILKTKSLIPLKNTFASISCGLSSDDQIVKYLVSLDNTNWFTYNADTTSWIACNIDEIEEKGITDFSTLDFHNTIEPFFGGYSGIGLAIYMNIESPNDISFYTSKDRVFHDFSIIEGEPALADSESCIRDVNFYFTNSEGAYNGNEKYLVCDTVLNKGITWNTTNAVNGDGLDLTWSKYDIQDYIQLIDSLEDDDDYTDYVLSDSKFNTNDIEATWVNNGATIENTQNFIARGDANTSYEFTSTNKDTNYDYIGIRPRLFFNSRSKQIHRFNSETYLPVVRKVADLEPGKAIACCYTATTKGTPTSNFVIGKNGKSLLPDYGLDTPDGYFYFICVGYAPSGALKCIADRNVQVNVSWEELNNLGYCVTSGRSLKFGSAKNCLIRLPNTVSETTSGWNNLGEWDECISYYGQHGISPSSNDVWNAASYKSWTLVTPQTAMGNRIVRGAQDETTVSNTYTQENYSSGTVNELIGFRPVIEIQTYVSEDDITTYPECTLEIVKSLGKCRPGQAVACEYRQDTSGVAGGVAAFNFNPDTTKDPIPDPAPATPNGKFYFVCVGYAPSGAKRFIADRNIQTSLSWEALNNANYCVTSGVDVSEITGFPNSIMRLMISDVTNYNMDISSSEWDRYLMRENIGNTNISASGCKYWNMKKTLSWMCNTPHDVNASGSMGTMSDRVIRGKETIDYEVESNMISASTTASSSIGFRPLLDVRMTGKSADHFCKINTTNVYEKNINNLNISIDGEYEFFDDELTVDKCVIKMFINNIENIEFSPVLSDNDHTYHYELPITKLNFGNNIIKIVITTFDDIDTAGNFINKIDNEFEYNIFREKAGDLSKKRDYETYTAGFDQGNMTIENKSVVNNNKIQFPNCPEEIKIPNNTISITFSTDD